MSRNAPSLTGQRATAGHSILSLGGIFKTEVAMMPLFDTPEQARPTRNNVCAKHGTQLKQAWDCPDCKGAPVDGVKKVVRVDGVGPIDAPDSDWNALLKETDPTLDLQAWMEDIDSIYFSGASYILFPNERKEVGGFLIIMELLRQEGGYLLATTQGDHGTARVLAIRYHKGLGSVIGQLCHHSQYLRVEKIARITQVIDGIMEVDPPDPKHLKMAKEVFSDLPETFNLEEVKDTLGEAQWAYIRAEAKKLGHIIINDPDDLEEALRASQESLKAIPRTSKTRKTTSTERKVKA